ncbi:MAG: alpha-hydroxy-acid oxidizing protein [Rhizobiales bacterium]|nr:alpha-hydroxy-acid oxidizing protein [Hyphomicrobiales bacterium]
MLEQAEVGPGEGPDELHRDDADPVLQAAASLSFLSASLGGACARVKGYAVDSDRGTVEIGIDAAVATTSARSEDTCRNMAADDALMQKYPMIDDLIPRAHRRVPRYAIDYLEHGAGRERLVEQNRAAFDQVRITPRYLRTLDQLDPSAELFGKRYDLPIAIAPVGSGSLIWPGAETINARAAARNNIPMTLSTVACATMEAMAEATGGRLWFQLYSPRDETIRWDLLKRAEAAGIEVLVLTVDVPVSPRRERTLKSGLSIVPKITPGNVLRAALHPFWSIEVLKKGIPQFRNFQRYIPEGASFQEAANFVRGQFGRAIGLDEAKAIRDRWPGRLVVKGILHPDDAEAVVGIGADGVLVSNHGGRAEAIGGQNEFAGAGVDGPERHVQDGQSGIHRAGQAELPAAGRVVSVN